MSQPENAGATPSSTGSGQRSQAAFSQAAVGIAIVMPDGRWLDVNPRLCEIVGYSEEELLKLTFQDITHAEDLHADMALVQQALDGEIKTYTLEKRYIHKDGGIVPIILTVSLVRDADGKPEYFVSVIKDNTERKRIATELQHERNFVNAVLDNAGALVVVLDKEGCIRRFNRACEELSHYSFAEVEGKFPWDILIAPEERETVRAKAFLAHAQKPQTPHGTYTNHWVAKDGERRLIEWSNTLLLDEHGETEFMVSIGADVTEKHRVAEALKRSEETYARAEAIAHIGSWDWDIVTNNLRWTDEIYRIFGLTPQSFGATYPAFLDAIHPDDRQKVIDAVNASVADADATYSVEHRVVRPDGEVRIVHERGQVYRDKDGKALRMIGTVHDITERKRMDDELRGHRERLEYLVQQRTAMLEQAQRIGRIGNWNWDVASGELTWSDEIFRIFGHEPGSFRPTYEQFLSTLHPDDVERIKQSEHAAFSTGQRHSIDHRIVLPGGELRWVHEEAIATLDERGQPVSLSGTVQDITGRKRVEEALIQARDEAERASRAKSEFLSRMSHELRTPMNAILGFSQVLEDEPLTTDQLDFVQEIHRAGDHLLELINDLLDLARIDAGKLATDLRPVALGPVVDQAVKLVGALLHQKGVALQNQCNPHIMLLADGTRLRQILVNLLSNAAKYNHEGGSVSIDCQSFHGEWIRLSITDTGPGIAPERLAHLFTPFERLGAEFTGVEGAGIGLALSMRLAELMGGTLGVESTPGQGSTFWLELPLAQNENESAAQAPAILPSVAAGKLKVLYVEDNAANLKVVEAMLRRLPNLTLISAATGEYGLELAQRYRPEVILLDIHLPGMDGYAVLKELHGRPETRFIPVIALSADAMPLDIERGLVAGFRHYLSKPVKLRELIETIERVLPAGGDR